MLPFFPGRRNPVDRPTAETQRTLTEASEIYYHKGNAGYTELKGILNLMEQERLDIISDVMALTSYGNVKNIILVAAETVGAFDEQAFASAARRASIKFPVLTSRLKEIRKKGRFFLVREHCPEMDVPIFMGKLSKSHSEEPIVDSLMSHMTSRLESDWDLFSKPPVEIHVLAAGNDRFVFVTLLHHSAGDAEAVLSIMKAIMGEYEAEVTGETPPWLGNPYVSSTSKKSRSVRRRFGWMDFLRQLKRDLRYRKVKPVFPWGSGNSRDTREWHVRRAFSVDDSARILNSFSGNSTHVIDHLVACTNLALDYWNGKHNLKPGRITSAVTVNMRGRFGGKSEKNYSSVIFLRSDPDQRRDYLTFVHELASSRSKQFEKGADLTTRQSLLLGSKLFYYLPFGLRRRVPGFFMKHQQYSAAVTFMGSLFPRFDGKGMGRDFLTAFGNLEIIDIYGVGHKHVGGAAMHLLVYVYRNRLSLVLMIPGKSLTKTECDSLMDVLVDVFNRTTELLISAAPVTKNNATH